MLDLEHRCRTTFLNAKLPIAFLDYYGQTGNIAILARDVPQDEIRNVLFRAVAKPCAFVDPEGLERINQAFNVWPAPGDIQGFRWTPGVSLLCDGQPDSYDLTDPDLGMFKRLTAAVVLLYRKERVSEHGALHVDRRGGWAAVRQCQTITARI